MRTKYRNNCLSQCCFVSAGYVFYSNVIAHSYIVIVAIKTHRDREHAFSARCIMSYFIGRWDSQSVVLMRVTWEEFMPAAWPMATFFSASKLWLSKSIDILNHAIVNTSLDWEGEILLFA